MARGEPPRPGSQLPAPYRSPWSGLAEALTAVLADRRLALQRLWRRNRDGELPRPPFWPASVAPLFWPLLLSAGLALLLGLGSWLLSLAAPRHGPTALGISESGGAPLTASPWPGSGATAPGAPVDGAGAARDAETAASPESRPTAGASGRSTGESPPLRQDSDAAGPSRTASAGAQESPPLQLDPLLELLSQGQEAELLLAARPDPAGSRLSLTLSPAAEALPQAALLEQAERWQQRARAAGYERLELRDRQGRLRGRAALVGSGMILLAPVPGS